MPAQVIVRELRKSYGGIDAVRGIDFEVERGAVFGLLGPNGAGKTTTLECLLGLREPDAGHIELCGVDARRHPREVKQKIGVALQATALPDAISPREAIDLMGAFYRQREETAKLLRRFDLADRADARFSTLSGGERQRLALALAFVNRPELVVLDEPTAGLDTQARRELRDEIRRMRADGCTVLLSTHDLDEAEELCDRVAIIDHGRILAQGEPASFTALAGSIQDVALSTDRPAARAVWQGISGLKDLAVDGVNVSFQTDDATAVLAELATALAASGVRIVRLRVDQATLEEAFLRLTQDSARGGAEERPA